MHSSIMITMICVHMIVVEMIGYCGYKIKVNIHFSIIDDLLPLLPQLIWLKKLSQQ